MTENMNRLIRHRIPAPWLCVLVGCLSISQGVSACSCGWSGPFPVVMHRSELVVLVEVLRYGDKLPNGDTRHESMTVEIKEVLKGTILEEEIEILGDPGDLCRVYIDSLRFGLGQEYLLALPNPVDGETPLSFCGEHWTRVTDSSIEGTGFLDIPYTRSLDSIREDLATGGPIGCAAGAHSPEDSSSLALLVFTAAALTCAARRRRGRDSLDVWRAQFVAPAAHDRESSH